jgi:hypothetical protein
MAALGHINHLDLGGGAPVVVDDDSYFKPTTTCQWERHPFIDTKTMY